jgi:NAD(P)-dependent dehydrogenase (short-subunit alcohol dehydrogenase family)
MSTRVALVTGGSSGIGEDAARRLRKADFEVYAVARRVERMTELEQDGIHVFGLDVTDDQSMVAGVGRVIEEQGRIDVLVNNAGYGSYGAVEDVPMGEARRQFDVNVFGLARMCQLVIPHMRAQQSGRIINISSIGGKYYEPLGAWYHATKFAVEGFSDSLRVELSPFGIDVVIIEPAAIRTEWSSISRDHLRETSAGGAYEDMAIQVSRVMERADRSRLISTGPEPVGKKIVAAALANTPRVRYPVGRGGRSILLARRLLPDPVFDYFVKGTYLR